MQSNHTDAAPPREEPGIYLVYTNDDTPDALDKIEFDLGRFDAIYSFADVLSGEVVNAVESEEGFDVTFIARPQHRALARINFWREEKLRVLICEPMYRHSVMFSASEDNHARTARQERIEAGLPLVLDFVTTAELRFLDGQYKCWRWKDGSPQALARHVNAKGEGFRLALENRIKGEDFRQISVGDDEPQKQVTPAWENWEVLVVFLTGMGVAFLGKAFFEIIKELTRSIWSNFL